MVWSETIVDKGKVQVGDVVSHCFKYSGDKTITSIKPLCSCIKITSDKNNYNVRWRIKKTNKEGVTSKMIEVKYQDGLRDYLIIKVNVYK